MDTIFNIDLQLFAEGEAAAAGENNANAENGASDEKTEKTFSQAEVENIINQRFAKLQRDAEKRVEQARKDGITEGERLAKMSAEEREAAAKEQAENDFKAREDALAKREAEVARKELRATALELLAEKQLPAGLADFLDYTDADACKASIEAVDKAFRDMVKAEVDKRLAASASSLPRGGSAKADAEDEDDAMKLSRGSAKARAEAREKRENILSKYK